MKKLNNKDMDKLFKDGLGDFQVPAPSMNKQSDSSQLDEAMRSKLSAFEQAPDQQNWNQIKRRIPLHLKMHRHLTLLSKIAAVLVVGLVTSLLVSNYQSHQADVANQQNEMQPAAVAPPIDADYVYDLDSSNNKVDQKKNQEQSDRELLSEDVVKEHRAIKPTLEVPELPSKPIEKVAAADNPLDEKVERTVNLEGIPMNIQKPVEEEMISSTTEEEEELKEKNN